MDELKPRPVTPLRRIRAAVVLLSLAAAFASTAWMLWRLCVALWPWRL